MTLGNQRLLTDVQADQLVNALLGDALTSSAAQAFVSARAQVLSTRGGGGYVGRSSGDGDGPIGVWLNASGVRLDDNRLGRDQKGWARSLGGGIDYSSARAAIGAFAAWSDLDMSGGARSGHESAGWTGGLYGALEMTPQVSLIGVLGQARSDVENRRTFGALSSVGETDRKQTFASVSVEGYVQASERWVLAPSTSLFVSRSTTDAYRDTAGRTVAAHKNGLSFMRVGTAAYYRATGMTPYVSASWDHYLSDEAGMDGDFARLGAGVAIDITPRSYLSLGASTTVGKKDERETTFGMVVGRRF